MRLKNIQQMNDELRKIVYNKQNLNTDILMNLDKETCSNILLTTAGSVALYYLFFEM